MPKPSQDFFLTLEALPEYKQAEKLIQRALEDQWNDLLMSGLINKIYDKYKDFFVNRRGVSTKIKKAASEGDIKSADDLKAQEQETLQGDRFLVGHEVLNLALLYAFLQSQTNKNIKTIASYYSFNTFMQDYLKRVSNVSGQSVIDVIPTKTPIKFRLSNKLYKQKIKERVTTLIKDLDNTTKKRMINAISEGIKNGERKSDLVKRLQGKGIELSKNRAKRIVTTETEAAAEFIRFETARLNGISYKVWRTAADEKVCPICSPLDGVKLPIMESFNSGDSFGGLYCPAHVSCRCSIMYPLEGSNAEDFVIQKKAKGIIYESLVQEKTPFTIVNPNAVWAGGESLVGTDKNITEYYTNMRNAFLGRETIKEAITKTDGVMFIDSTSYYPITKAQEILLAARRELTDAGFVQLIRCFGFTSKVPTKQHE